MAVTTIVGGGGSAQIADSINEVAGKPVVGRTGVLDVVAYANETELTSTSATTIITHTPTSNGLYYLHGYVRVITASTTVTVTLAWDDVTGAQSNTLINAVSESVGNVNFSYIMSATTAAAITVTATAGTANQVFISCYVTAA